MFFRKTLALSSASVGRRFLSSTISDVLVLGTGVAGSTTALTLAQHGHKVTMISAAQQPHECNSYWAQGGIIYKGNDDTPDLLAKDVHYAGAGLCKDEAVMQLAKQGPRCVEELLLSAPFAVPFDRDCKSGELALCLEASHSSARIVHWRDQTGRAITEALLKAVDVNPLITVLSSRSALDLLMTPKTLSNPSRCIGARVANRMTKQAEEMYASHTILATGGLGEIFQHTSNHSSARGDGIAMAHRAGAQMSAMEYVQFHPTTFHFAGERSFLLTEALRGEGARLLNHDGEFFAKRYHELGELAPRDVVSRMIMTEIESSDHDHMWLDISHRDANWTKDRFPMIYEHCVKRGFDMTQQPLPVVPAAHYFCGGVKVDLFGRTSVPGLYAGGEVSCTGLHGANRLASTSLLEGLVWGRAIGDHIGDMSPPKSLEHFICNAGNFIPSVQTPSSETAHDFPEELLSLYWQQLKHIMWEYVGITRTVEGLTKARSRLYQLEASVSQMRRKAPLNEDVNGLLNAVQTGLLVCRAARKNRESRGTHFILQDNYTPVGSAFKETLVPVETLSTDTHTSVDASLSKAFGNARHL